MSALPSALPPHQTVGIFCSTRISVSPDLDNLPGPNFVALAKFNLTVDYHHASNT
jgi:hypothetical protein